MLTTKGMAWIWHRDYFIKRFGQARVDEVKAKLAPEHREVLFDKPVVAISRVPLEAVMDFLNTADRMLGTGNQALINDCLREKARTEIKGVYKIFVSILSPELLIKKTASMWQHIYQQGDVEVVRKGPKAMDFIIRNFAGMPPGHDVSVVAYTEEFLNMCNCKHPTARIVKSYTRGDDHCLFEFKWE